MRDNYRGDCKWYEIEIIDQCVQITAEAMKPNSGDGVSDLYSRVSIKMKGKQRERGRKKNKGISGFVILEVEQI